MEAYALGCTSVIIITDTLSSDSKVNVLRYGTQDCVILNHHGFKGMSMSSKGVSRLASSD